MSYCRPRQELSIAHASEPNSVLQNIVELYDVCEDGKVRNASRLSVCTPSELMTWGTPQRSRHAYRNSGCSVLQNVYMVMELCTGGELFDRIVEQGQFSERDAAGAPLSDVASRLVVNVAHRGRRCNRSD